MPRPGRYWIPLDVDYWDHPQIAEAGEPAACLYLRLLSHALRHETDGWVPARQPRAWYDDWKPRLDALVLVGLVTVGTRNIDITDWDKWHQPVATRKAREAARLESQRERQRRRRSHNALVVEELEASTRTEHTSRDRPPVTSRVTSRVTGEPTGIPALMAYIREVRDEERAKENGQ